MLESIFILCAWLIQLIAVFLIPGSLLLFCYKKFSSKTFLYACITIVLIFSILLGACLTAPIQRCNSGIYSKNIPVIPLYIKVIYADETIIRVRTFYYLFGTTEMVLGGTNAPSVIKRIVDWNCWLKRGYTPLFFMHKTSHNHCYVNLYKKFSNHQRPI